MSVYVDIKKDFKGFSLSVKFEAGNGTLALLGASGCGKSVTLKCIAGVITPDEGQIVLNNQVVFDSKSRVNLSPQNRKAGLLFQNYALFPNMTVKQNILSGMRKRDKAYKADKLLELLDTFYLTEKKDMYPSELSGGQRQRTALARILASSPQILMLDEPLSALDSYLRWKVEQELGGIFEKFEGTVIYVSHNRDEIYRVCDTVCVINNGSSERLTTVKELFKAPSTLSAALLSGCKNFSRAVKNGDKSVYALDWGVSLICSELVGDDVGCIGVRAHHLSLDTSFKTAGNKACHKHNNSIKCLVEKAYEDVFGAIIILTPEKSGNNADFSQLRMEITKDEASDIKKGDIINIAFSSENVMLLSES